MSIHQPKFQHNLNLPLNSSDFLSVPFNKVRKAIER
jgi:hypothetical protein